MFHLEFRQFPHVARAFNLSEEEVLARVAAPWAAGQTIVWEDRRWAPDRARLTILEGPELATADIGMGRGWANASRTSEDVTATLLAHASAGTAAQEPPGFKAELLGLCADGWVGLSEAVRLAGAMQPQARASERLALAEQSVWELLHEGRLDLAVSAPGQPPQVADPGRWQQLILAWDSWSGQGQRVEIRARGGEATPGDGT